MKKTYETPEAEKMLFSYRDQVVAASGCMAIWNNQSVIGGNGCTEGEPEFMGYTKDM